jgi:homoserine dehydrogenase
MSDLTNAAVASTRRPPLRIALAGLGTVGAGVIRLVEANADLIARRAGRPVQITAISARDRSKDRGVDLSRFAWEDDMTAMAAREDVDVVVELVGGSDGPALTLARNAINHGKALVTANKAMIAHHGMELAALPRQGRGAAFRGGGRGRHPGHQGLARGGGGQQGRADLWHPQRHLQLHPLDHGGYGRSFADVLSEAQAIGYAEADPTFDIEGTDAAHKLSILSAIAFGSQIDFASVDTSGISRISAADIAEAEALGYIIRLIGMAESTGPMARRGCSSAFSRIWCRATICWPMSMAPPMRGGRGQFLREAAVPGRRRGRWPHGQRRCGRHHRHRARHGHRL